MPNPAAIFQDRPLYAGLLLDGNDVVPKGERSFVSVSAHTGGHIDEVEVHFDRAISFVASEDARTAVIGLYPSQDGDELFFFYPCCENCKAGDEITVSPS